MKIREATAADGEAIRMIVTSCLREFNFEVEADATDADLARVPESYHELGGIFRVVEDDGRIVGCAGLLPLTDDEIELRKMYFVPAARGKGGGRLLLDDLVQQARGRRTWKRIVLETASRLETAIAMYQRFGFVETFGEKHACRCDRSFALEL
jgi:putative acetyltransferase